MPGSTTLFPAITNDEVIKKPQNNMMGTRQPPPVAPRTTSITLQSWEQAASGTDANYGNERYARSASTDSLESSGSSSSGGGNVNNRISEIGTVEYIPTRTIGKTPKLPPHNPLQFVKVQSPLYIKAEQQIKLTKEVKITREALKESEEEWQSNLDNWKSRRRKVSEKVIQRAEEMRQIEAEEQLRQEQLLQQQKKIKKFSEIVEKKASRSYNLDLYIGQGDDSGLGGTPEPDEMLDGQSSLLRSDTSEGMTSESESIDSDIHKSDKIIEKEPPKVAQKPYSRFKKSFSVSYDDSPTNSDELFQQCLSKKDRLISDNNSSAEPSDVEGHTADTEATSSEEDVTFSGQTVNTDSGLDSLGDCRRGDLADSASDLSQDGSLNLEKSNEKLHLELTTDELEEEKKVEEEISNTQVNKNFNQTIRINIKPGDNRGFGFTLKGGKDHGCSAYIENVVKGGAADEMGLKDGDKIISLNGELTADYSHASLIFSVKQAVYTGILDLVIDRSENFGIPNPEIKPRESRKGKSFAEKLAIFSAGINAPTGIDEPKSNAKLLDTKRESLVLRRRSAFENGKNDSVNTLNRRSSCVSHSVNVHPEKILEKRHSVDFILPQNVVNENSFNKKGPPPPIPVKPKIKSKPPYFDLNKPVIKTNGSIENSLSSPSNIVNGAENHYSKSQNDIENFDALENRFHQEDLNSQEENSNKPFENDAINLEKDFVSEKSNSLLENNDEFEKDVSAFISSSSNEDSLKEEFSNANCSSNFDAVGDIITDNIFTSFEANEPEEQTTEIMNENETMFEAVEDARYSFFDRTVEYSPDSEERLYEDQFEPEPEPEPEAGTSEEICTEDKVSEDISHNVYAENTIEQLEEITHDIDSECCLETDIIGETGTNSVSSACNPECDTEDYVNDIDDGECNDYEEICESEDPENRNSNQSNTSPLCLSLEKIDEDDVDISTNLNSQFESDIDNPWLYYTEDSELLDLTPRKLEPPKEPPPPPPPPDAEDNDNKITSLSRNNSTKRIKRELWRRRSDFLGIEPSEEIDIDNIPPPPPGLEELLKQEREQTKWLEKRLSLAESETDIASYSMESACLDSGNYSNDYTDYILDDNIENTKDNIESEQEEWKKNMDEEPLYETNYGVQYEATPDQLSTVIEEPIKLAESPQHKAKQAIHSLGAAPKAKIIDSTKWITEKVTTVNKKPIEPVFRQTSYNQNYWLAQDGERRRNMQYSDSQVDRRYSMPPVYANTHPDVTVRTWGDREYEYQQQRPRSAVYDRSGMTANMYDYYMNVDKKDLQRTQSLDSRRDVDYETGCLEPEVHKCSCCGKGLCEGSAMGIEALRLYFHIECFRCCLCHMQLGNGSCGTDVQVKNNQLYCPSCFTVD